MVCRKSRKVPRIMQDEDASPNRWMTALIAVSTAQALSALDITPPYPFCRFTSKQMQTMFGAPAVLSLRIHFCFACSIVRRSVYG